LVPLKEHVGEKIKKIRTEHRDTLKELSKKIDYDYSNLSKVERGKYGASVDLIKRLSNVYDVSPSYFFGDGFTNSEGKLLIEVDLDPSELKEKYDFKVDGTEATEEEIMEAIRMIRYMRNK
jgi:transcriptional regulator with XRE-family HTH domain